ncbi:MAG TPA: translocation/assembly module TamB domain-containing protein [Burkholderiales bacterium]
MFADRVVFQDGGTRIVAETLGARLSLPALLAAEVSLAPLSVERLSVTLAEGDGGSAPRAPRLPIGLRLRDATLGRLELARGDARLALRALHVERFSLAAQGSVSGAARFTLLDERFPAAVRLALEGTLERLQARLGAEARGARAELAARLAPFAAQRLQSLELEVSGVDLQRFFEALPATSLQGSLRAEGTREGLRGTLSLVNAGAGPLDAGRLPVARLRSDFSTVGTASASFAGTTIEIGGGGVLHGGGELAPGRLSATLQATALNLRALRSSLRRTALEGALHAVVTPQSQSLRAALSEQGIRLSLEALRRGERIEIGALHAEAQGGEASGAGVVTLGEPARFEGRLRLSRFDPSAFGDYPGGSIEGTLEVAGALGESPYVDARWTVADSVLYDLVFATQGRARFARRRVSDAEARATLGESELALRGSLGRAGDEMRLELRVQELSELAAQLGGRLSASGTLRGEWSTPHAELAVRAEALELPGGVRIARASARFGGSPAAHGLSLTAHAYDSDVVAELRGGWDGKEWRGELVSLSSAGSLELETLAPAPLAFSRERVELGRLEARLERGRLLVRELVRTRERVSSSGEFSSLPAAWLIEAAGLASRMRSTLYLDGQWTIDAAPSLEGTLRVRRSRGDLAMLGDRALELGLEALSIDARFAANGIAARMDIASRIVDGALGGQIGRAPGKGGLGLGSASPILLQGGLDLASLRVLAGPYLPEGRVDGKLSADVDISGTLGAPLFNATLRGQGLGLELPPYGVYLRDGELTARLEGDRLRIDKLSLRGGQGTFSAEGTLPLRLADGNAKLAWHARRFTVLDRPNLRLVASGDGEAGFDGERLVLSGALRADRGTLEYAPERLPRLADDIVIEGQPRRSAGPRTPLPIALDIDLDLGDDLAVRMRGLEGELAGRVNMKTGKQGELLAYGELHTVNATYFAYGQRLIVDPGVLIFDGPIDNPALQITAWRRNQAVEAGVQLSGTVRAPRVQLVSQPPVPEGEKLSWLVLGRAPSDATKADLGLLQAAAAALLTRGDTTSMPLDRRLARTFGLDEITFRGSGEAEDRVVAFGKRLSDRLYVSYEQGIGTVVSNLVKLDYSLGRRWSLRAETGTSSGGGLFYRFSWD